MSESVLSSEYDQSWAIAIGVDAYDFAPPLLHAAADARAIVDSLKSQFAFADESITLLLNSEARRDSILEAYLALAGCTTANDRVVFFFAGHGHTEVSTRGEVGYLVPQDGDPQKLHTLIRWDELTRNADLISAKHMFFMMDACYGGLAIQRALPAGSSRFLKDMLRRPARQVLTAGKADEPVSDAGGPLPEHSVFTGFVLLGLRGDAATPDGIISANSLMPYVYQHVSRNEDTQQTPHFGYLSGSGDGDFIFDVGPLETLDEQGASSDVLIQVPGSSPMEADTAGDLETTTKSLLSDPAGGIRLYDLGAAETRQAINEIANARVPLGAGNIDADELNRRLELYDNLSRRVQVVASIVSHWGHGERLLLLDEILARMADFSVSPRSGKAIWIALEWFPVMLLTYASGVAAMHAKNWEALATILNASSVGMYRGDTSHSVALILGRISADLHECFKLLPDHENNYVPRSEYLLGRLQPLLDDLFFMGSSYENAFDRFEAFFALGYADLNIAARNRGWAPPGRFSYKYAQRRLYERIDPLSELLQEAASQPDWPPLKYGLFGGDYTRVKGAAEAITQPIPSHWGF